MIRSRAMMVGVGEERREETRARARVATFSKQEGPH